MHGNSNIKLSAYIYLQIYNAILLINNSEHGQFGLGGY